MPPRTSVKTLGPAYVMAFIQKRLHKSLCHGSNVVSDGRDIHTFTHTEPTHDNVSARRCAIRAVPLLFTYGIEEIVQIKEDIF
jgi:hypothetical protein